MFLTKILRAHFKIMDIKKIAIIGSNSFSGSHAVDYFLTNSDARVIGISRSPEYDYIFLPYLYKKERSPKFKFFQLDVNKDMDRIINLLDREEPEAIINFAAQGNVEHSWKNPEDWFKTNCLGVMNLTNRLKDKKYIKKYIQISTPEIYGPCENFKESLNYYSPSTPYAASKAAADLFLLTLFKNFNFPVSFVRSANVYGTHQQLYRIIPKTVICLKKGEKLPLQGGGKTVRSFVHIKDVFRGIHDILMKGKNGEVYHFATEGLAIRDLVKKICSKMNRDFESSVEITSERVGKDSFYGLDSSKAKKELNWEAQITLNESINEVIAWINECWNEILKYPADYIHQE